MAVLGIEGDRSTAATKVAAAFRNAFNPTTLVALLLAAVLVFLVANPLFQLVKDSFTNARDHSFTFANYVTAFGRPRYVQALINSVELGAVAALFASIIAGPPRRRRHSGSPCRWRYRRSSARFSWCSSKCSASTAHRR